MRRMTTAMLVAAAACTPLPSRTPDAGAPPPDAGTPLPSGTCATTPTAGVTVELDPDGTHRISPRIAFDGTLWVTWLRAAGDGTGGFDVWATRLDCDGTVLTPAFRVNEVTGTNDVDARLAIGPDSVLIAWTTDDSEAMPNLELRYRLYRRDGTPRGNERRLVTTDAGGSPVVAPLWTPDVAALDDGTFAIAGTRGLDDGHGFQPFVQRLTADGDPSGATLGTIDPERTAANPALATDGTRLFVAWHRESETAVDVVRHELGPDATSLDGAVPVAQGRSGDYPALVADHGRVVLAFTSGSATASRTVLESAELLEAGAPTLELGADRKLDYGPALALASASEGAVTWFRVRSNTIKEAWIQRFSVDGAGAFTAGALTEIDTEFVVGHAAVSIAHVRDGIWFVAWTEGTGANARARGRFVELGN